MLKTKKIQKTKLLLKKLLKKRKLQKNQLQIKKLQQQKLLLKQQKNNILYKFYKKWNYTK